MSNARGSKAGRAKREWCHLHEQFGHDTMECPDRERIEAAFAVREARRAERRGDSVAQERALAYAAELAATEANPFSTPLSTVAGSELLDWLAVADRLAAGPLAGDAVLAAQRAAVEAEARLRRLVGGPARLTAREEREMREGQE